MRRTVFALLLLPIALTGCNDKVTGSAQQDARTTTSASRAATTTATVEGPVPLADLSGTWTGTYTCAQGETALTLTIEDPVSGSARTVFAFGPSAQNPTVPHGSFEATARYANRLLGIVQKRWIDRPSNYEMIDLQANAVSPSSISGTVQTSGCTTFKVTKDRH
ncbi:hypothetical protein [Nocardia sp. NPDC050406]|uniref:hypothetical protein n=1 Tax=Nocardia sp. NPDC050406 TaxID=3364318 RepID=UPI0037888493